MTAPRDDDPPPGERELLVVGYVAGVHGIRGALRLTLHDPDSDVLVPGRTLLLRRDAEVLGTHEVRTVEPIPGKPGRFRVTLRQLHDRTTAEALRGCELLVDRDQLPALADDEFYLADAIGLPVQRERAGVTQPLGTIVGLTSNGVQDLFEVQWRDPQGRLHEWLLPVLPQHVVDLDDRRVLVDLPLGMLPDPLDEPSGDEPEPPPRKPTPP